MTHKVSSTKVLLSNPKINNNYWKTEIRAKSETVLWFRRLAVSHSSRRPVFVPRPFYVEFMVDKEALVEVFVLEPGFSLSVLFHKRCILIHL